MKKMVTGLIVLVFGVLFFIGYRNVNQKYLESTKVTAQMGEKQPFSTGGEICVKKLERRDKKIEQEQHNSDMELPFDYRTYLVYCEVSNGSSEEQALDLTNCYIETMGWANGINMENFFVFNPDLNSMSIQLKPGESREVILPYQILSNGFQKKEWEQINTRKFMLTYSEYPVKYSILL